MTSSTEHGRTRSGGDGIEREVIHTIFEDFRQEAAQWFTFHADGQATLTISHSYATARFVSASRKRNMAILGAATALCLIRGMSTPPLDPILLHFFIHDCQLDAIHPGILGEWHPDLKQLVSNWIRLGPDGDPSLFQTHFATYHDLQVSSTSLQVFVPLIMI
jgi:hypothetical protein